MSYAELSRLKRKLDRIADGTNEYLEARAVFKDALKDAFFDEALMGKIRKRHLLNVCGWLSTYRPVDPRFALMRLGSYARTI